MLEITFTFQFERLEVACDKDEYKNLEEVLTFFKTGKPCIKTITEFTKTVQVSLDEFEELVENFCQPAEEVYQPAIKDVHPNKCHLVYRINKHTQKLKELYEKKDCTYNNLKILFYKV